MKKILLVTLFAALMAFGLTACGQSGSSSDGTDSNATATTKFSTMADVFAVNSDETQWSYDEKQFDYVFLDGGNYVAVAADLSAGMQEELDKANFEMDKIAEIVGPLTVARENTYPKPSDEDVKKLVGKTGGQLAAEGFEFDLLAVNGDETDCSVTKLPFDYLLTFEGAAADDDPEKTAEAVKDLKVKDVFVQGLNYRILEGLEGADAASSSEGEGEGDSK